MIWQREYWRGSAMAVPTSEPCSAERTGTGFHPGRTFCVFSSPGWGGLGNGTSKSFATLSASSSTRCGCPDACGVALACCTSAGFGAMAAAAMVFTVRAAR